MARRDRIRRHLSFANVASALALFLAIGGGTTAIALRGVNKVDSGDIRNGAVKTRDLGRNAATGAKVREGTLGIVPLAARAENAEALDGISSEDFQFGNGVDIAFAGGVDDGATFGRIDLGSATLEIDCESTTVNLNLQDDPGGATPDGVAPTDVWIAGTHEAIITDGGASTPVPVDIDPDGATVPVQVWTTDNVMTDGTFSAFFDTVPTNDLCVITLPMQQNLVVGSPTNSASARDARAARPSQPQASGLLPLRSG